MPAFPGIRPWVRGLRSKVTASTATLAPAELLVDEQGGVYGGAGLAIKDTPRLATEAQLATYMPLLSMAADGSLSFAQPSAYGVDSTGQPYQNPAGAAAGEGAYLTFDPSDGSPVLIPLGA